MSDSGGWAPISYVLHSLLDGALPPGCLPGSFSGTWASATWGPCPNRLLNDCSAWISQIASSLEIIMFITAGLSSLLVGSPDWPSGWASPSQCGSMVVGFAMPNWLSRTRNVLELYVYRHDSGKVKVRWLPSPRLRCILSGPTAVCTEPSCVKNCTVGRIYGSCVLNYRS